MAGQILTLSQSDGVAVAAPSAFTGINAVSSANYTGTDTDGYNDIHVTTGASDRTYTPPTASSSNTGRVIRIMKMDSGAGGVVIAGTISGSSSNNTIKLQYGRAAIISTGSAWVWVNDIVEAGAWTPVPAYAGGSIGAINLQSGRYTRNGRFVTFFCDVAWRLGTGTGACTITGLPYSANVNDSAVAIGYLDNVTIASGSVMYSAVTTNIINFYTKAHSGASTTMATATATQFANTGSDMRVFCTSSYSIA